MVVFLGHTVDSAKNNPRLIPAYYVRHGRTDGRTDGLNSGTCYNVTPAKNLETQLTFEWQCPSTSR